MRVKLMKFMETSYKIMGNFQSAEQAKFPLKIRKVKHYGCSPDIPDQRDIFTVFPKTIEYYQTADLRKTGFFPDVFNQGALGSSVAHALLAAYIFSLRKDGISIDNNSGTSPNKLSPQFIYYNQRVIAGTTECDSGSSIRDGIKVLERLGVCTEELYPYNCEYFRERPTDEAYANAYATKQHIQYRRIRVLLEDIMKSISIKCPVIMGFTVYDSFEHPDVARTGIMPVPKPGEKIIGHHCVLIVGYDIPKKYLLCRNSWGDKFGQAGYFWVPFSFVNARNCSDLWIISTGTNSKPVAKLATERVVNKVSKPVDNVPYRVSDKVSDKTSEKIVERPRIEKTERIEKEPDRLIEKVEMSFKDDISDNEQELEEDDTMV